MGEGRRWLTSCPLVSADKVGEMIGENGAAAEMISQLGEGQDLVDAGVLRFRRRDLAS